jgi:vacuolar-type H+-ATPase subunit E/Vma4
MKQAMLAANAEDQALLKEAVAAANRPELKISSEPANITGGFLVQGAQVDFDFSVESLMDTLRETLTEETSRKLFGEAES